MASRRVYTGKNAIQAVGRRNDIYALEAPSVAHDAVSVGRDRDYRGFGLFPQDLFGRSNISLLVFNSGNRDEGGYLLTVNLCVGNHAIEEQTMLIEMIAYKQHMRWLKICEDNLMAHVRDWGIDFEDHLRQFRAEGRKTKLAAEVD